MAIIYTPQGNPSPWSTDIMTGNPVPKSVQKKAQNLYKRAGGPYNGGKPVPGGAYNKGDLPAAWTGLAGVPNYQGTPGHTAAPVPVNINIPSYNAPQFNIPGVPKQYQSLFNQLLAASVGAYNRGNPAAKSLLNPSAILSPLAKALVNPNQIGNDAGLSFDSLINSLTQNEGQTKRQNAQNLKDISDWYGQAQQTAQQGQQSDAAALAQAVAGNADAGKAFASLLGGDAGASVAKASDIAGAALQGQGNATNAFDQQLQTILGSDRAGQLKGELNAGNQRVADLINQIAGAKQDKTAAIAQARDNALNTRYSQLSDIANMRANLQGNLFNEKNALQQQKQSQLGDLSSTVLNLALAGPQIQQAILGNQAAASNLTTQNINQQIGLGQVQQQAITNASLTAQLKAQLAANPTNTNDISNAPLSTRQGIDTQFSQKGGMFVNQNGDLKMAPPAIKSALRNQLISTYGIHPGPSLEHFLDGLTASIVTPLRVRNYDKAHKTTYYKQGGYQ